MRASYFIRFLMIFFLLTYSVNTFSQCTTTMNGATTNCISWFDYCPNTSNVNYFPVLRFRLSIHVIQNDDGSGNLQNNTTDSNYIDSMTSSLNRMMRTLPQPSPQHELNPSPLFRDSKIQYVVSNIFFHRKTLFNNDSLVGSNIDAIYDSFIRHNGSLTTFQKDSTIHVFLVGENTARDNRGSGVTYNKFNLHAIAIPISFVGQYPSDFTSPACNIAHEIGHVMGLHHVFFDYRNLYPNNQELGYFELNDMPTMPRGQTNNFMDYGASQFCFTSSQIGRLRKGTDLNLNLIQNVLIKDWCSYNALNTITIPSSTVAIWKFPRKLSGDIIVSPGATLSIQADVSMPPGGVILVEPGATLDLEHCKINNQCGHRWGGIIVEADALGSTKTYGNAILNDAVIENAEDGLRLGSENAEHWGGTASAFGTKFKNCRIGVWAEPDSGNYSGYGNEFDSCVFITDGNVPGYDHGTEIFVKLDGNTHYHFHGDSFINTTTTSNVDRGIGIKAVNSSFTVRNSSYDSLSMGCSFPYKKTNIFKGLSTGINFNGTGTIKILDAKFVNIQRGIKGFRNEGALIYNNNFFLDNTLLRYISGTDYHDTTININMDSCTRFDIRQNYILFGNMTGVSGESWHIAVKESNADSISHIRNDSLFVKNTGTAFGKGIAIDGNNNSLLINCNNFIGLDNDLYSIGGTLGAQGDASQGANNRFSTVASNNIDNSNGNPFDYNYLSGLSRGNPSVAGIVTVKTSGGDSTCPGLICWTVEPSRPFELKQNNENNKFSSSMLCKAYPNPASGNINFEYNLPASAEGVAIVIYNEYGRVIARNSLNSNKGLVNINTANWMSGIYFYRLNSSQKTLSTGSFIINNKQ